MTDTPRRQESPLTVVTVPAEILHRKMPPVDRIDRRIATLCRTMIKTIEMAPGIGLAGPQVGKHMRLFVVHLPDDVARVFINPELVSLSSETASYEEGCLSIPGVYAEVDRPVSVRVQAWNGRGKRFTLGADGLLARVIQHEYDHLNGILFWDHFTPNRRKKLMQQYEALRQQSIAG